MAATTTSDVSKQLSDMSLNKPTEEVVKHSKYNEEEEILKENPRRFCLFPIKYHEVYKLAFLVAK